MSQIPFKDMTPEQSRAFMTHLSGVIDDKCGPGSRHCVIVYDQDRQLLNQASNVGNCLTDMLRELAFTLDNLDNPDGSELTPERAMFERYSAYRQGVGSRLNSPRKPVHCPFPRASDKARAFELGWGQTDLQLRPREQITLDTIRKSLGALECFRAMVNWEVSDDASKARAFESAMQLLQSTNLGRGGSGWEEVEALKKHIAEYEART